MGGILSDVDRIYNIRIQISGTLNYVVSCEVTFTVHEGGRLSTAPRPMSWRYCWLALNASINTPTDSQLLQHESSP